MAGYSVTFSVVDQATAKIDQINRRIQQLRAPLERQARAVQQFINVSGLGKMAEGFNAVARGGLEAFASLFRLIPVVGQLGAVAVATAAGMGKLAKSWAAFANPLTRDADQIGTTAATLETLQDATRAAGGSVDDMTESLKGLTTTAAGAFTGRDPNALAWFNRANINLRDMNGHLRTTTDLLPEALRYLDSLKNPADQMTAAVNLGGTALYNLTETLRRAEEPGETLTQTFERLNAAAAKRQMLTQADEASLRDYNAAVGDLDNAMIHLEHSAGGAAARGITPLLRGITLLIDAVSGLITGIKQIALEIGALMSGPLAVLNGWVTKHQSVLKQIGEWAWKISTLQFRVGAGVAKFGYDKLTGRGETFGPPVPPELMPKAPGAVPGVAPGAVPGVAPGAVPGVAPGAVPIPPRAANVTPGNTAALQKQAIDYFVKQGWSPPQAAGILANVQTESSLRANAVGDAGAAYGLGQWHADRQAMFKKVFGHDIRQSSFGEQLAFVDWELKNTERGAGERLRGATTARQAGGVVSQFYERPGDVAANIALRGGLASKLLAQYPGQAAPPTALAQATPPPVYNHAGDLGQYRTGLAAPQATGAPAQVTGGAPVNGSVDVTITHKNPPPSDTLAATSTGDGINLAPPRTERQQLNAA